MSVSGIPEARSSPYDDLVKVRRHKDFRSLWVGQGVSDVGSAITLVVFPLLAVTLLNASTFQMGVLSALGTVGWLLTALLALDQDQLAAKIALYRKSRADHGHDPSAGQVTLMIHSYVGARDEDVLGTLARSLPEEAMDLGAAAERDRQVIIRRSYDAYHTGKSLMGTPEQAQARLAELGGIGVDEVAALVDFGLPTDRVLAGIQRLGAARTALERARS